MFYTECPGITNTKCGLTGSGDEKDMKLKADSTKASHSITGIKYLNSSGS